MLTLAVSRGRIWEEAMPLLAGLGIVPDAAALKTRQLIIPTQNPEVRLLPTRAQDAPVFVARGAAQAGIAGRDVLAELRSADIICPLDLCIAKCRMVSAALPDFRPPLNSHKPLMVATKYPNIARAHFAGRGIPTNIIKLHGSMELAPQVGVADMVVDLAASGRTLRENGLVEIEKLMDVSAMWIVNRVAMRRLPQLREFQNRLAAEICPPAHPDN